MNITAKAPSKKSQLATLLAQRPYTLMEIAEHFQSSRSACASLIGDLKRDKLAVHSELKDGSMFYSLPGAEAPKSTKAKFGRRKGKPEPQPEPQMPPIVKELQDA